MLPLLKILRTVFRCDQFHSRFETFPRKCGKPHLLDTLLFKPTDKKGSSGISQVLWSEKLSGMPRTVCRFWHTRNHISLDELVVSNKILSVCGAWNFKWLKADSSGNLDQPKTPLPLFHFKHCLECLLRATVCKISFCRPERSTFYFSTRLANFCVSLSACL